MTGTTGFMTFFVFSGTFYAMTLWGVPEEPFSKYFGTKPSGPEDIFMQQWFALMLTWVNVLNFAVTFLFDMTADQIRRHSIFAGFSTACNIALMVSHSNKNLPFGLFVPVEQYMGLVIQTVLLFWLGIQLRSGKCSVPQRSPFKPTSLASAALTMYLALSIFWFTDICFVNGSSKYMVKGSEKRLSRQGMAMAQWFGSMMFAHICTLSSVLGYGSELQLGRYCLLSVVETVSIQLFAWTATAKLFDPAAQQEGMILRAVTIAVLLIGGMTAPSGTKAVKAD